VTAVAPSPGLGLTGLPLATAKGLAWASRPQRKTAVDRAAQSPTRSAPTHSRYEDAPLDLARVLQALDRPDDAVAERRAGLELCTEEGHRPGIKQTRALLDELEGSG